MGFLEGRLESLREEETSEMSSSSGSGGSATSGNNQDNQGGDVVSEVVGEFMVVRMDSPMLRETGLIAEMEREAMEAGLGEWFNRNPEDVRAGVVPTPTCRPVRIELEQLS